MEFAPVTKGIVFTFVDLIFSSPRLRLRSLPVLAFALLLFLPSASYVKVAAQATAEPASMSRIGSPAPSGDDIRYRIGPGDVLQIVVRKAPELSGTVRVDQRGMIRLPMIEGDVSAACRTESELALQIRTLYLEFKNNPNVDVFVAEFQSRPVAVIGAINGPGQFRLQRQVRLLELLTFAGGPANKAGRVINIIHTSEPNVCRSDDSNNQIAAAQQLTTYKLNDTLKGKAEANPFVQPGDIISLPEADQVFVIGHVQTPQALFLRDKTITISKAIMMCGGPARDARTTRIRITRQENEGDIKREIFVNLNAVLKYKAVDLVLLPNDIIEVPSSTGKVILNTLQGVVAPALQQLPIRAIP
jgi:polysaccharide export outer membrane protein